METKPKAARGLMVMVGEGTVGEVQDRETKRPACLLFHCRLQTQTSQSEVERRYNSEPDSALRFISGSGRIGI